LRAGQQALLEATRARHAAQLAAAAAVTTLMPPVAAPVRH
jgi:hypothetical protein